MSIIYLFNIIFKDNVILLRRKKTTLNALRI